MYSITSIFLLHANFTSGADERYAQTLINPNGRPAQYATVAPQRQKMDSQLVEPPTCSWCCKEIWGVLCRICCPCIVAAVEYHYGLRD